MVMGTCASVSRETEELASGATGMRRTESSRRLARANHEHRSASAGCKIEWTDTSLRSANWWSTKDPCLEVEGTRQPEIDVTDGDATCTKPGWSPVTV
jgi:hypothetical protein